MKVSVCMPTYGRPDLLKRALGRLTSLDRPDGGYEVIVVDDGSPDGETVREILASAAASSAIALRWDVFDTNRGAAAARNRAWHLATGEWIAFTDDDCVPRQDWLVRLLDRAEITGADVVQGRTCPESGREQLLALPFTRSVRVDGLSGYYETCNIAYRRGLLRDLGGFDEGFRLACDDTDLGWRAGLAGATAVFAEDAVVEHAVSAPSWRADLRSRRRWADAAKMVARHPDARRLTWRPFIYRKGHLPVLAVAASLPLLGLPSGRRAWLAMMTAAVAMEARAAGSSAGLVHRFGRRAVDAYETAVLVRASIRERTVLL